MFLMRIPVTRIAAQPYRPVSAAMDRKLREDIAARGLQDPIQVRAVGKNVYTLVAGRRRLNAVIALGKPDILCHVV